MTTEQRFEALLVEQCAPTLAGVKPASLFRFGGEKLEDIRRLAEEWDRELEPMGLSILVLKECREAEACMLYVYRREWVQRLLTDQQNLAFLRRMGYQMTSPAGLLQQLSGRFCLEREYPHEIGVFLGYPLEDVVGFIENRGWNYTCCGCWKAYGNPKSAQKCFARYRRCTAQYKQRYQRGTPVMKLIVAA